MCGINGIISKEKDKDKLIKEMNKRIVHRGPDAEGIFVEGDVALGQRRLSIIDLAGGNQPIYNEDKSILIMYNGEVYNYKELKEEKLNGHKLMIVREETTTTRKGATFVAADSVGAGIGEMVLVVSGSTARRAIGEDDAPIDSAIVGIIDSMEISKEKN